MISLIFSVFYYSNEGLEVEVAIAIAQANAGTNDGEVSFGDRAGVSFPIRGRPLHRPVIGMFVEGLKFAAARFQRLP